MFDYQLFIKYFKTLTLIFCINFGSLKNCRIFAMSYTNVIYKIYKNMELTKEQKLRPAIEALGVTEFVDLPKDDFTASAARQAVQRIYTDQINAISCVVVGGAELWSKKFQVSETAYPGGTRVTRLA